MSRASPLERERDESMQNWTENGGNKRGYKYGEAKKRGSWREIGERKDQRNGDFTWGNNLRLTVTLIK